MSRGGVDACDWQFDGNGRRRLWALIACAALGWASIADGKSQEGWSLYDRYTKSYTIPFARPVDFRHDPAGAFVNVSVNGGSSATFQLDTGSQGMVVPRSLVPDYVPKGKTASIHYASSGVTAYGHWAKVSVDFTDSTDASGNVGVASAKVPVLVADKVCDANGCSTDTSRLPLMIGIGFGRPDEEATGHHATLADNPLLHIKGMDSGVMRSGYVFTPDGVEVGLTRRNAGTGFAYVQLVPETIPGQKGRNWSTMPGTMIVSRGGSTKEQQLPVLVDTGISYLWGDIGEPSGHSYCPDAKDIGSTARCAAPGSTVSVYFGGTTDVGYSYVTGATDDPVAPWFTRTDGISGAVNTGIHPLAGFSYVFDAKGGFVGLRRLDGSTPGVVFRPFISASGLLPLDDPFQTTLPFYLRDPTIIQANTTARFLGAFGGPGALEVSGKGKTTFDADLTLPAGITIARGKTILNGVTTAPLTVLAGAKMRMNGSVVGDVANSGKLTVAGSIAGSFDNGGLLKGKGAIAGKLVNGGVVAPGPSLATLAVKGDVGFDGGSVYRAEIGAAGKSDLIDAGGHVVIAEATLLVKPARGSAPGLGTYTVLSADKGVSGAFVVDAPEFGRRRAAYPFLAVTGATTPSGVDVIVGRSSVPFTAVASTSNQRPPLPAPISSRAEAPSRGRLRLSTTMQPSTLSTRSPVRSIPPPKACSPSRRRWCATASWDACGKPLTPPAAVPSAAPGTEGMKDLPFTAWGQGYDNSGGTDATGNTDALNRSLGGFLAGIDGEPTNHARFGIAFGYGSSSFDIAAENSSASANNYDVAAYAGARLPGWGPGALSVRFGAAYGWHDVSVDRRVAFGDFADAVSSDYDAATAQLFGEVAYGFDVSAPRAAPMRFEPFAGLAYTNVSTDGFAETGGPAALSGAASDFGNATSQLGLRVEALLPAPAGEPALTLHGMVGWQHVFGDLTPTEMLALAGAPQAFAVAGAPLAEDSVLLDLGLDLLVSDRLRFGVSYVGNIAAAAEDNAFKATLLTRF